MDIFGMLGIDTNYVILGLCGLVFILLILFIIDAARISGMKKRYKTFMEGENGKSLETAILEKFAAIDDLEKETDAINRKILSMDRRLKKAYQKYGVVKYDAFSEIGGKLSFVIVLLTDEDDGVIINSMHSSKEGCYMYAKEVVKGEVDSVLSSEETEALNKAKNFGK